MGAISSTAAVFHPYAWANSPSLVPYAPLSPAAPTSSVVADNYGLPVTEGSLQSVLSGADVESREPRSDMSGLAGGRVGMEAQGYLYSPQTKAEEILPSVWGKYKGQGRFGGTEGHISTEGLAVFHPAGNGFYFEAAELYAGTPADSTSPVKIEVGRKLEHWNLLDERWQLGIWQPRFLWDYIHPEEVALSGAFLAVEQPGVRFVLFGSPVFVPDRGVPVSAENGQLISQTPWFISPPSQIEVLNRTTNVNYQLAVPPTWSIVQQWSVGWLLHLGAEDAAPGNKGLGPWFQASQAWLPMNQLLLAYHGMLAIDGTTPESAPDTAQVTIYPRVLHHYLTSLETGYQAGVIAFSFSSLWDVPTPDTNVPPDSNIQQTTASVALSPSIDVQFHDPDWGVVRTYVSYLCQWGGNAPDVSNNPASAATSSSGSLFDPRYPYQRAVMFGGSSGLPGARAFGAWLDRVTLSGRILYDLGHQGTILSTDIRFEPLPRWEVNFGADLLGSTEQIAAGQTASDFIGRYQANDDIRGGLSYAF
jgi:hypothetical protein